MPAPKNPQPTEEQKVDELIEAVAAPKKREQLVAAGPGSPYEGFSKVYVQQKLSFFGKLEFTRLISRALKKAVSVAEGEDALNISGIVNDLGDENRRAESFITAMIQLAEYVPDILKDVYMISLNVPEGEERAVVSSIFNEPHDEDTHTGGLSDEDGFAILHTFVAQNARVMRDFFLTELPKLIAEVGTAMSDPESTPAPSKPSKRSARSTQ